ncbi:MAG TPA: bifunctional adenosylcobinamide kinase/adenosylcobinamide-phosphate guanylyltransferase [Mycobacteriales bacterium]|jgi:adenosyl cobinamide kinase/adenosyl cobinamide phosphate guanylyltransferase|nr:bifunctional adenosylcobinamide kinase/adenosylcobinamide-phosphate guanylyltransferase [Mycobacteriales bacterium]
MTVRILSAGDSTAALVDDVLFDCGTGILAAAAFGGVRLDGVRLDGVRHLLLSGTGPDRIDPALAAAPPTGLRIHPPGTGPVRLANGAATELIAGAWLLETADRLVLHAPDPLPPGTLDPLADRSVTLTVPAPTAQLIAAGGIVRRPVSRVLVTGGSRSGKSQLAEELLADRSDVVYLATGPMPDHTDAEWARRIQVHRDRRPAAWTTVETLDAAAILASDGPAVLLDGLGTWLAGVMDETGLWDDRPGAVEALQGRTADLVDAWRGSVRDVVAVTDEVGSGVVPATSSGRLFRDELGRLNAAIAAGSDEVWLVTAGIGQRLR